MINAMSRRRAWLIAFGVAIPLVTVVSLIATAIFTDPALNVGNKSDRPEGVWTWQEGERTCTAIVATGTGVAIDCEVIR